MNFKVINFTEFKNKLKESLDAVTWGNATLFVLRTKNSSAVVMSLEEYNALIETQYLLSTEANRKHLMKSLKEAEAGKTSKIDGDHFL
jgi:antitoxin YefM